LASDISSVIQNEIINTFESLLSVTATVEGIDLASSEDIDAEQFVQVTTVLKTKIIESTWNFIIPTDMATKFEYFMLGGMGDLKSSIDDEIVDATKEIISTICGSISTSIDAQNFEDINKVQISTKDSVIVSHDDIENIENLYKFAFIFNDEPLNLYIQFDNSILEFLGKLVSGDDIPTEAEEEVAAQASAAVPANSAAASILALLGEESTENLKLLFDVKLRFSVRLGTKTFLLKDIVNWDVGKIIELEQMVNEPLDILVNGTKVGEGEAVIVDGKFGVKIKYIGEKKIEV